MKDISEDVEGGSALRRHVIAAGDSQRVHVAQTRGACRRTRWLSPAAIKEGTTRRGALMVCALFVAITIGADAPDPKAVALTEQVMKASGADQWDRVKRVRFIFNVEEYKDIVFSAKHDWDVGGGTVAVSWAGKSVTLKLGEAGTDDNAKAAFQRWTNDSYWLLMPLKLKDAGCSLRYDGERELDGKKFQVLHLSREKAGVSLGEQYNLYIDPETHRVQKSEHMSEPDKKTAATWEKYEKFGPLTLSTEHRLDRRRFFFTDVSVETD